MDFAIPQLEREFLKLSFENGLLCQGPVVGSGYGPKNDEPGKPLVFKVYLSRPATPKQRQDIVTAYENALRLVDSRARKEPYLDLKKPHLTEVGSVQFLSSMASEPAVVLPGRPTSRPGKAISAQNGDGDMGTFGAVVRRREDGRLVLLSCAHVVEGNGYIVDEYDRVIASDADLIRFDNYLAPLEISADAGIAFVALGSVSTTDFPSSLGYVIHHATDLVKCHTIAHAGAGSGELRQGHILDAPSNVVICQLGTPRIFSQCVRVKSDFAVPGDSGSIVVDLTQHKPAGIVFAKAVYGDEQNVFVCSLKPALDYFGVDLL